MSQKTQFSPSDGIQEASELPRVAFFTPAPDFGGAQRVTVTIANSLARRGHEVTLVAGELEGEFVPMIDDVVNTVELGLPDVPTLGVLSGVGRLATYLETAQPAVLFVSRTHTNVAAILAGGLAAEDVHIAVTEHSVFDRYQTRKDRVTGTLAAQLYRFADDVIAVSEGVAESVVDNTALAPGEPTVLHNPVDVESIRSKADEPTEHRWLDNPDVEPIVSVGRLKPVKDYATLIRAFASVTESRPETRLIIVGKGPERDRLEQLARDRGVAERVSFPGYRDNPYPYMQSSSVFVLSSKSEGLPTALIEALACGCTVVSTDCRYGPREILVDGKYGRLTPVGEPAELAAGIENALEAPMPAEKSHARAEHFSTEAGADRYEAYIRSVTDTT
ncbi:MAG: glycosyltransferase [Haloarcula sp.]